MAKKKVLIGMSGGVDSSVAAALLLQQGYEVIGVTMKIWNDDSDGASCANSGGCCSLSAVDDARRVANLLGIPYYVMNFEDVFKSTVIDYFVREYENARTPNPCIACNRYVKFGALLEKATAMGIDYVATGHYAKIIQSGDRFLLKKSVTAKKDQTYALYNLTQPQLARTLMPVGEFDKHDIRRMAKDLGMDVAQKPDSQEICFIPDNDYSRFIKENTGKIFEPGNFLNTRGEVIGRHTGIIDYTIGQRKGLGMTFGTPMYVVSLDALSNTVKLGEAGEEFSSSVIAQDLNFISIESLDKAIRATAKVRYSGIEVPCTVTKIQGQDSMKIEFDRPVRAATPGQSVVMYDGDIVIGGGTIVSTS